MRIHININNYHVENKSDERAGDNDGGEDQGDATVSQRVRHRAHETLALLSLAVHSLATTGNKRMK